MRRETYSCCFEDGEAKVKRNAGDLPYLKRRESCWLTTSKKTQISVPQLQELNSTNLSSHDWLKRCLLLGRKVMTNLDSILKSRDIVLPTKVPLVNGMVFPLVMYGCESWTIKKAEHQRIDAFELWCWKRLLRVSCTARRFNQSILKKPVLNTHWKD